MPSTPHHVSAAERTSSAEDLEASASEKNEALHVEKRGSPRNDIVYGIDEAHQKKVMSVPFPTPLISPQG